MGQESGSETHPRPSAGRDPSYAAVLTRLVAIILCGTQASAADAPLPYGPNVTAEQAQRVLDAAEAAAREKKLSVAIAIVEPNGSLVLFKKMTGVAYGSADIATAKARTAALYRLPSSYFAEMLAKTPLPASLPGVMPAEGGVPLVIHGQIIGAVGVSGSSGSSDQEIARRGALSLED
jgi:glc operon protein GlcG